MAEYPVNIHLEMYSKDASEALGKKVEFSICYVLTGRGIGVSFAMFDRISGHWFSPTGNSYNSSAGDLCCKDEIKEFQAFNEELKQKNETWSSEEIRTYHDYCDYIERSFKHWDRNTDNFENIDNLSCPCEYCWVESDPEGWMDSMSGVCDWSKEEWDDYGDAVPTVY